MSPIPIPKLVTSDAKLIRRALADDSMAFETLVHRYQKKATAIALAAGAHPSSAADVVQDSFLEVFLHLPELRNHDAFGAWLLSIVRNHARRSLRRHTDQTLEGEYSSTGPDDTLETREFNEYLWQRVRELPEDISEALVLYYYEGERVREVARALGVTVPAVKNRLKKGRDLLRERLWREVGQCLRDMLPSTRSWNRQGRRISIALVAALPLGWNRSASAAGSAGATFTVPGASIIPSLTQGVAFMTSKYLGVAAGFCIGLFLVGFTAGYVTVRAGRADGVPVTAVESPAGGKAANEAPAPRVAANSPASEPDQEPPVDAGSKADAVPATTTGSLRVSAVWEGSEEPAEGIQIRVIPRQDELPRPAGWTRVTDEAGVAKVGELPPGDVRVEIARMNSPRESGADRVRIVAGGERQLLLRLPEWITVKGTVVDWEERPVGGAEVWLSERDFDSLGTSLIARAAADGTFRLRGVQGGRYVSARATGYAPSSQVAIMGNRGDERELRLVLPALGGAVSGHVFGPGGAPLASVVVLIGHCDSPPGSHVASASPLRVNTAADGGFIAEGIAPGVVPVVARAPGLAPAEETTFVEAGRRSEVALRLLPGAALAGRVLDEAGGAIAGAEVQVGEATPFTQLSDILLSGTRAAEDGAFQLAGLPSGERKVMVKSPEKGKEVFKVTLRAGEVLERDFILRQLHIRGRILLADGTPARKCMVSAIGGPATVFTDRDGRFLLADCEDRDYTIEFVERGQSMPSATLDRVRPSPGEVEVVISEDDRPSGYITGKVVGPDGSSVRGASVQAVLERRPSSARAKSGFFGGVSIGPVPPGTYTIYASADEYPVVLLGPVHVAMGETVSLGEVKFPAPGFVKAVFVAADGRGPDGLLLRLSTERGQPEWTERLGTEPNLRRMAAPGRHRLALSGDGVATIERDLEVSAGQETVVELPVKTGRGN